MSTSHLILAALIAVSARAALTEQQLESAIREGSKYKTADKFLDKGLKGMRVKLGGAMSMDGISKYATFFGDWYACAAEAAAASQQMREIKTSDCESNGLLHAFVELHARGDIPASKMNRRYRDKRAHLVLKVGERVIQPVEKSMRRQSDQGVAAILAGMGSGKITLKFAFDVAGVDLRRVDVILVDGDGNKHEKDADLSATLAVP